MPTFTKRIAASLDDGYKVSGGSWFGALNAVTIGNNVIGAFRFTGITIPQGATITAAKITLQTPSGSFSSNAIHVKIYGIAEDNTATFSSDPTGRSQTTANAAWDLPSGQSGFNTNYDTSDITSVVQEIVNRGGWASGNAMGFFFQNNASSFNDDWKAYDVDTANAALLTITYSVVGQTDITKSLKYTVAFPSNAQLKLLRYYLTDPEINPVHFLGLKVAKPGHNAENTSRPENLNFSSDFNTLKYFMEGKITINVNEPPSTIYNVSQFINHNLGYYPFAIVYAQDNSMPNAEPLGRVQAGSGITRNFSYYLTANRLYLVASGSTSFTGGGGDVYPVTFYYKIFKNNLGL